MLFIRGTKVSPAQVESLLFELEGKEPEYRIVIDRKGAMDEVTILVEASRDLAYDHERRRAGAVETIRKRLSHELGVSVDVQILSKKSLDPVDSRAKRIIDNRHL